MAKVKKKISRAKTKSSSKIKIVDRRSGDIAGEIYNHNSQWGNPNFPANKNPRDQ